MARPKKNAAQAQDALPTLDTVPGIPVEEQPYPLPEGWKWVRLGDVVSISKEKMEDFSSPTLRYIGLEHFEKDNGLTGFTLAKGVRSIKNVFYPGQVLYGKLRPYLNKHDIANFYGVCSTDILVFKCSNITNNKFFNYAFNLNYFISYAVANSKGTNLPRVSEKIILDAYFPLPPLEVQQRIVERIESLFAKLDEAREKAESALESFERRKAAILHKAFTGELTRKWREENGIDILTWEKKELGSIASLQTGLMKGRKFSEPTILKPYLRVANVQDGFFDLNEIKQIKIERGAESRWALKKHDVLFTEGGDFDKLGRGAVWEEQILDCLHQNHIFVVRVNDSILNPYFLSYQARSIYGKKYFLNCAKQTTNLASINSTQLKNFPVLLPSLLEQREIVRILDRIFVREQQAREAAENVLQRIGQMKKAILARAFRGELD